MQKRIQTSRISLSFAGSEFFQMLFSPKEPWSLPGLNASSMTTISFAWIGLSPPTFDVADVGEYHQPRCPKCESLDVISEFVKKVREDLSAESGAGAPAIQTGWKCQSCGHVWPVSSDEVSNP